MSPVADSASPAAPLEVAAAEKLLDDGEVILLATRPSGWFVLVSSWPVLAVGAVILSAATVAAKAFGAPMPLRSIGFVCGVVGSIRLAVACGEWVGRLYILTTRRVMRVSGVMRATIDQCPLRTIAETTLTAAPIERPLGVASLSFQDDQGQTLQPVWTCLPRAAEVRDVVDNAILRTR